LKSTRDTIIDRQIADAARQYAEDPEAFFFNAVAMILGISQREVAERFKKIIEASA